MWVDDVFVKTSVREHRLRLQITVKNDGPTAAQVAVTPQVTEGGVAPALAAADRDHSRRRRGRDALSG